MTKQHVNQQHKHRLCVAPMMDWTDRHCRYFHRLLAPDAMLYTEMVTTGALLYGDQARHLDFHSTEHPVALQLGGSDPTELKACSELAKQWGYDEVNLNVGCPSDRVQKGRFGACLMREPELVRDCLAAMSEADIPVSIKTRLGVDDLDSQAYFEEFMDTVIESGVDILIIHARKAWLSGLSPKQNREVPPLHYDWVYALKQRLPGKQVIINGGIDQLADIEAHLQNVDGVMLGRAAYQNPWLLQQCQRRLFKSSTESLTREKVLQSMIKYAEAQQENGVPSRHIGRHLLGLMHAQPGGRAWRRHMSECLQNDAPANEWLPEYFGSHVSVKMGSTEALLT